MTPRGLPVPVEVWKADLAALDGCAPELEGLLSPDEARRAARYRAQAARHRFVAARGLLRRLLAERLSADPREVEFRYGPAGKPSVAGGVAFSVAHAGEVALFAISPEERGPVGVDVEWAGSVSDPDAIVRHFGTAGEREAFAAIPAEARRDAFLRWWTRKESVVKARGLRLLDVLRSFEAPMGPEPLLRLSLPTDRWEEAAGAGAGWLVRTWPLEGGYVASLALRAAAAHQYPPASGMVAPQAHASLPLSLLTTC